MNVRYNYWKTKNIQREKFASSYFRVTIFTDTKDIGDLDELIDLLKNNLRISSIFLDQSKSFNSFMHMTKAQIFLISNSTFSLWAALLSKQKASVYLPKKWQKDISIYDLGIDFFKNLIRINAV